MRGRLLTLALALLFAAGIGGGIALGGGQPSIATVTACATATAPGTTVAGHDVSVDGGSVASIPAVTVPDSVASQCETTTYTVPTSTETVPGPTTTVTTTVPADPPPATTSTTTTPVTTTAPVTTTSPSSAPVDLNVTNKTWICSGPVDLGKVTVTISGAAKDAVHLHAGCTGHIKDLVIVQHTAGDGMKIGEGMHDVAIDDGSMFFDDCPTGAHQDGIQAMGGQRFTWHNPVITTVKPSGCLNSPINNAAFFVNQGNGSAEIPTDIVLDHALLRNSNLNNTAFVNTSIRSGLRDSIVCGHFRHDGATDPVDVGNTVGAGSPGC